MYQDKPVFRARLYEIFIKPCSPPTFFHATLPFSPPLPSSRFSIAYILSKADLHGPISESRSAHHRTHARTHAGMHPLFIPRPHQPPQGPCIINPSPQRMQANLHGPISGSKICTHTRAPTLFVPQSIPLVFIPIPTLPSRYLYLRSAFSLSVVCMHAGLLMQSMKSGKQGPGPFLI